MQLDADRLDRNGYLLVHDVPESSLIDVVRYLEPIRVDPRSPEPIRDIRPESKDSAKTNTLSSRYGTDAFPFHTDTAHWERPARYLALYCIDAGEGHRATLLQELSTMAIE